MTSRFALPAVLLLAVALAPPRSARAADPVTTEGRVTAVTVYQGQALVTREIEVPEANGLLEVIVTNLPEHALPGSLFAEPTGGMQIRSVRYRARPIEEDVRREVRELDEQIEAVRDKLAEVVRERALMEERKSYLGLLEHFVGPTSQVELSHGVLNAETLQQLTEFVFAKRQEIAQRELELAKNERDQNKSLELLSRKRDTIAAGSARTVREAVVFINATEKGAAKLRLSYLVDSASWSPSYNLRAADARDQLTVEYNASIEQMSGEDWSDVEMTLSTATPSLVAKAPTLEPLAIRLGSLPVQVDATLSAAANYKQVQQNLAVLGRMRGAANSPASPTSAPFQERELAEAAAGTGGYDGGGANYDMASRAGGVGGWAFGADKRADEGLNEAARELQLLDYNNSLAELKQKDEQKPASDEGVSVSYRLANRTSLPSRSDRQLIQIAAVPLKGDFYRVATPVLTSFVYEEARLANTSDMVFLAGPVATFLGGQFVGRGDMPTVAVGESFTVGLGIDSSLRAGRELVDKTERIQGGNRVVDFTYELVLENFGDAPAKVRVLDRLPKVGDDDIKVTLVKSDEPPCEDESYKLAGKKEGILRWDVEVPAQAIGPKHKPLKYTMQIEYDKQLAIIGMPVKK